MTCRYDMWSTCRFWDVYIFIYTILYIYTSLQIDKQVDMLVSTHIPLFINCTMIITIFSQGMVHQLEESLASSDRLVGHLRAEKQKESVAKSALMTQSAREASSIRTQLVQVGWEMFCGLSVCVCVC